MSEDTKKWDGVGDVSKEGGDLKLSAESGPFAPRGVVVDVTFRMDSASKGVLCSSVRTADTSCGDGWKKFHDVGCG